MDVRALEKNKYYYGKLLTVTDFDVEQQYYAQKTKLINRIMFGAGVASGLQVTKINETQLAVENGVAFDYDGNLILIPIPQTITLSKLSGFLFDGKDEEVFYLCIQYKENEKDIVKATNSHVPAGQEHVSYNRKVESYELYLQQGLMEEKPLIDSMEKHYKQTLSQMVQQELQNSICLAKVIITREGHKYTIKTVEKVPFHQYVINHDLIQNMIKQPQVKSEPKQTALKVSSEIQTLGPLEDFDVHVKYDKRQDHLKFKFGIPKLETREVSVKTGVVEVDLQSKFFSEVYITEEIEHGLGLGSVYLDTSIESIDGFLKEENDHVAYYGDADVFVKTEDEFELKNYAIGCVLYPNKGTFKIGMKYHGAKKDGVVSIRWWAIKGK